jgi:hypothetical protein
VRLTSEISKVADSDADLFGDLAVDAFLERLTGFDEACQG